MEGDRSYEIKQMGRNRGHSCPEERYGQKKHEIKKKSLIDIEDSETECGRNWKE
jgi:hypothetical protein